MADFRLTIERALTGDQGTPGIADLHNAAGIPLWAGFSIELPWRNNAPNVSCVLMGMYIAKLQRSKRFGYDVYVLQNVPGRENCEIHDANWAGDVTKGYRSDLEGCTALGMEHGVMPPPGLPAQLAVMQSDVARKALIAATGGADIEVEYRWADGCDPALT